MVTFNENKAVPGMIESFTVTISGDKDAYIETIRTILLLLGQYQSDIELRQSDLYYICNLIDYMLPDSDQVINKNDVELLNQIKEKAHENASANANI